LDQTPTSKVMEARLERSIWGSSCTESRYGDFCEALVGKLAKYALGAFEVLCFRQRLSWVRWLKRHLRHPLSSGLKQMLRRHRVDWTFGGLKTKNCRRMLRPLVAGIWGALQLQGALMEILVVDLRILSLSKCSSSTLVLQSLGISAADFS